MKRKLLRTLAVSLLSVAVFGTTVNAKDVSDFTDVHENDWYYATVKDVAEKKLMTGLNETTFGPSELLARGQFACVLYRMEGSPEISYETIYPDVADGQFYSDAITWANKSGTITGYENGLYGVADNITREQLVTIMYRYAKASGRENVSEKADLSGYPDSNKVTAFAKEAMQWAVATGVIKGDGVTGELQPQGNVSRAVCATIISRYAEKGHWETINHPAEKHWDDKLTLVSPEEGHWKITPAVTEEQKVTDKKAWTEEIKHPAEYKDVFITTKPAWNEPIYEVHRICKDCREYLDGYSQEQLNAHAENHWNIDETTGGWADEKVQVGTEHHDAEGYWDKELVKEAWTEYKNHPEEFHYETVTIIPEKKEWIVTKEAIYEGGWVVDKEAWSENVWIVE